MSPESTRGWDIRMRAWVRHPPVDAPSQSVCYQVLPPNGAVAALGWRSRQQQAGHEGARPHVSRVLIGNTGLLTPGVAIALCRMGLPAQAGERPGQVAAGAELPTVGASELVALASGAVEWLDREAQDTAADDGLTEVIAAAIADPGAPLAIGLSQSALSRPPGDGPQARLLWGLWRIARPLLGTVRRGWSFSTFEVPLGAGDPAALADIVFRSEAAAIPSGPAPGARKEARAVPGDPGALEGTPQAWLAEWLVAEYQEGGGDAIERLIAQCGVEQPLQARLAAVYDLLHGKWARTAMPVAARAAHQPALEPEELAEATVSRPAEPGLAVDLELAEADWQPGPQAEATAEIDPGAEPELAAWSQARSGAGPGTLGPSPREGTAPPLPLRDRGGAEPGLLAAATAPVPPRLYEPGLARSAPDLLIRLIGTQDSAEFKLLLQDVLTLGGEPDLGNRVDARRLLFEARWCTDTSRPADRQLHGDELARIFSVILIPDLDRPRVGREIAEWAALAPPPVIGGLLAAARGDARAERAGWEKYQAMMSLLQLPLAQRWAAENGLRAEWDSSFGARSRRVGRGPEMSRGFLGFRKRGPVA